ncbi:MAG: hypothetical protein GY926_18355 [bacterium]|nr:hypothetical protein [bacterium]
MSAVAFTDGEQVDRMTLDSPTLVFLNGHKVLANSRCLLPGCLRCEALWEGDVPLMDQSAVPKLLRALAAGRGHQHCVGPVGQGGVSG